MASAALDQHDLELQAQHDVQVVGGLVGIDADEGRLHLVDGLVEVLQADAIQLGREQAL